MNPDSVDPYERFEDVDDDAAVNVKLTDEGIIVDAFEHGELVETFAKTWEELFMFVTHR